MKKVAYFLSDLHLGGDAELDDFDSDAALAALVEKIGTDDKDAEVDLVLLGDIFDLWQIVPPADKTQPTADAIDIALDPAGESAKIRKAAERHPQVFAAFRHFLESVPSGRLVSVEGNHDHSLINSEAQKVFRNAVGAAAARIVFDNSYDNPELRVYGEHGNQYDRDNNSYKNFAVLAECPGYYFVRLFWNRMEPLGPELNRLYPGRWHQIFRWLVQNRKWNLFGPAIKFFRQYRCDKRVPQFIDVPGVPFFAAPGGPAPRSFETFPELLFSSQPPAAGNVFSHNPAVELTYRRLYETDAGFRKNVDNYFQETFGAVPVVGPPSPAPLAAEPYGLFGGKDPYLKQIEEMFDNRDHPQPPYFRARPLEADTYDYVVFGHTHEKLQKPIGDQLNKIYFNTGSWVTHVDAHGKPVHINTYLRLEREDGNPVQAVFTEWT